MSAQKCVDRRPPLITICPASPERSRSGAAAASWPQPAMRARSCWPVPHAPRRSYGYVSRAVAVHRGRPPRERRRRRRRWVGDLQDARSWIRSWDVTTCRWRLNHFPTHFAPELDQANSSEAAATTSQTTTGNLAEDTLQSPGALTSRWVPLYHSMSGQVKASERG
eukprot:COSAG06_NODE_5017_length_3787_cov_9.591096_2_plen_166_part_00